MGRMVAVLAGARIRDRPVFEPAGHDMREGAAVEIVDIRAAEPAARRHADGRLPAAEARTDRRDPVLAAIGGGGPGSSSMSIKTSTKHSIVFYAV